MRDLPPGAPDQLLARIAEDLAQPPVDAHEAPVVPDVLPARAGELEGVAEARLALAQARLGVVLRGDVADGRNQAVVLGLVEAPQERGVHRQPGDRAVAALDADHRAEHRLAGAHRDARRPLVLAERLAVLADARQQRGEARLADQDRKSTRLNS